jgi:hypothetical protein
MTQPRPYLYVSETNEKLIILIIDKVGIIGQALAEKLKDQFTIVIVTGKVIQPQKNIIYIHYGKKIPEIPDEPYAAIITIYNAENSTLDMLPAIIKKINETNSRLLLITSLYHIDEKITNFFVQGAFEKITPVIYAELFGNDELGGDSLSSYIHQIRTSQKIEIPGSGLQKSYLVHFDDTCDALIALTFSTQKKTKPIFIGPVSGVTQLAIARYFQKKDPLIKINFKKEKDKLADPNFPKDMEYYFPNYNLEQKIKEIDLSKLIPACPEKEQPSWEKPGIRPSKPWPPKNHKKTPLLVFIIFAVIFFLGPICLELLLLLSGNLFLFESVKSLQDNNIPISQRYNLLSNASFTTAKVISPILIVQKENLTQKAQTGKSMAQAQADILNSIIILKNIYEEKSLDPKNDFLVALAKIKNSIISLERLKAEGSLPGALTAKIAALERPLELIGNTIDTYPDLFGFNGKRKYLILFQNNMELRPGGGFIGSYATVDIQNGKTDELKIHDIYDADGNLSTHVEPPFAIRRYLGNAHWFFRDSNFNIDSVENAKKAISFLELETGEKADGVITIDTDFLKSMISLFGPIYVPDYKETVTADNFYLLTQNHAEKDFFPGSTQKKDFLRALSTALQLKITESKKPPFMLLAQKLSEAIDQKHLLIAVPGSNSQTILSLNNLSGSLQDNRQKQASEFSDFLGINEANLGGNKTNLYLHRSLEQKVNIDDQGRVLETINISYENTSTKTSIFGGDYKNYLRLIVPSAAQLQTIEINGAPIATTPAITDVNIYTKKGFAPPPQLEVEKSQQNGKTIYGFLTIVPMGTQQKISIIYSLPSVINTSNPVLSYDLYLLKQPGTGNNDPYTFSIAYPKTFQAIQAPSMFTDVGGKLIYSDKFSTDKRLTLKFSKK